MASRSKLTECIDICMSIPFTCEDFLLEERGGVLGLILSAIALVIRGLRLLISIPWRTCNAASKFPLWCSSLPNNARASCLASKSDSEQIFARQPILFEEWRCWAKPHNLVKGFLLGLILLHLLGYHQELFLDLQSLKMSN